ncbi:hypothetical protein ACFL96_06665 [Thermoproteota archaeon]
MNKRLTDFEDTKDMVIGHHKALNKKPSRFDKPDEEDTMLDMFFEKE